MGYHLHRNGQSVPYELSKLRTMAKDGDLAQDEYIYVDEKGEWIGAAQVPEMAGAWNIGENEATVAMEIPADFGAMFDELEAKRKAASTQAPEPEPQPVPARQQAAPAPQRQAAPQQQAPQQMVAQAPQRSLYEEPRGGGGGGGRGGNVSRRQPGEILDPMKTTLFGFLCFIYMIMWIFKRIPEINTFLGEERLVWWHFFIPILNIITLWKMFKTVPEMAGLAGAQIEDRTTLYLICWLCVGPLGVYFFQSDLNAVWAAAGARPKA